MSTSLKSFSPLRLLDDLAQGLLAELERGCTQALIDQERSLARLERALDKAEAKWRASEGGAEVARLRHFQRLESARAARDRALARLETLRGQVFRSLSLAQEAACVRGAAQAALAVRQPPIRAADAHGPGSRRVQPGEAR